MEILSEHIDFGTRQISGGSQPIYTDQLTANNEQNLLKDFAQEITSDIRRKRNPPGPSVWTSAATHYRRASAQDYRDNKRNFRKGNSTDLRRS
jgi:hypothetical protein